MIEFLESHFRYNTMNSWNRSSSYAADLKIHHLGLPNDIENNAFKLLGVREAYEQISFLLEKWNEEHQYRWQVGFNGRSGGYLVLYEGSVKPSGYKSYCMHCGQQNYKSTAESGTRCGVCKEEARVDYKTTHMQVFYSGRSVDMNEDFSDWEMRTLRDRVELVQSFDQLCDQIVEEVVYLCTNFKLVEKQIFVPKTIKVLEEISA